MTNRNVLAATVVGVVVAGCLYVGYSTVKPVIKQGLVYVSNIAQSQGEIAAAAKLAPAAPVPVTVTVVAPPGEDKIRASDLAPGQIAVAGVGREVRSVPYYPVRVLSNIPGAIKMRFGNTSAELKGNEWVDYAAEAPWGLRTGFGSKTVLAEYQTRDGIVSTSALTPAFDEKSELVYTYPMAQGVLPDPFVPDKKVLWGQDFSAGIDGWVSYDYNGGVHGAGNVFYPASWNSEGYIWTDSSRWRIDTPENPDSILVLLTYPRWLVADHRDDEIDLTGTTASISLRGRDLDLKGGTARLFINTPGGRWYSKQPLAIGTDDFASTEIQMSSAVWEQSWDANTGKLGNPLMTNVLSFGVKFTGFSKGVEPTGALELSEIVFKR